MRLGLALLLRHRDVAVERGPVLDGEPAHLDVPVQPAGTAERQPPLCGDVAGDLTPDRHVGALDRGLDGGGRIDRHVSAGLELAFDIALDLEVPLDLEAPMKGVATVSYTHLTLPT